MKQQISVLFIWLIMSFNSVSAQSFRRDIIPSQFSNDDTGYLSLLNINDSLKYFEFLTPAMAHGELACGILSKTSDNLFDMKYADADNFAKFGLLFKNNTVEVINIEKSGYVPQNLKGIFILQDSCPKQKAYSFPLNYKVKYKAKKDVIINAYEYPSFQAKSTKANFKKGVVIEEGWKVGVYRSSTNYDPIENKSWSVYVYNNGASHSWFLISDVYRAFDFSQNKKR